MIYKKDQKAGNLNKGSLCLKEDDISFISHSNTPQLAAGMETSPITVVK